MSQFSEKQLVVLAQQALPYDTRFYQQLISPYISMLKGYCFRLLFDHSEAEDATQEVLIKALKHLPNFKWNPSFKAWLFKIAHNECLDRIRQRQQFDELEDVYTIEENEDDDFNKVLNELMQDLTFVDRNILLLRYRSGLEFQEIADICEMKVSAVKMRHKRVLDQLKAQFEHKTEN